MINLWEVGVDGAARNFSRIRRELVYVLSGLQQLEKLFVAHNKDSPSEEERHLLAALKNSAEKAMDISHKAASACFQKTTKPADNDLFQPTRGYSFTESSTRPVVCRMMNYSSHSQLTSTQSVDVKTHAKDPVVIHKRPFSMMAAADSPEDSHASNSVEDGLNNHLLTVSEDHFKKVESNKTVNPKSDYTEWTPDDPPEHKPEQWQPKENVDFEPYRTHINAADEIRNRRSKLFGSSHSVDQTIYVKTKSHNDKKQGTEKSEPTERHRSSVSPTFSDASDSDLQLERVMSKISSLEEERLNLMQTIEILQSDNVSIRKSLRETLGTLEMKDVQLKLAMQDLGVATNEIKKASDLNGKLRTLERYIIRTLVT